MRDLTDRALDTAVSLGAEYADARVVRRLERVHRDQDRPRRRRRLRRERRVRRPRPRRWRVGLCELARPDDRRGRPGRRRSRAHRSGVGHRPARPRGARRSAARPRARSRPPSRRTRSRSPSIARSPTCSPPTRPRRRQGHRLHRVHLRARSASGRPSPRRDGSFTEQTITHVGSAVEANAIDGDEHQRRSYPDAGGGWQAAGYEYIRGLDLAGARRAARRGGRRAAQRAAVPVADASRSSSTRRSCTSRSTRSCGHPTELDRVFGTEASYAGTSFLTTDKLEDGFRYGSTSSTSSPTPRRPAAWARSAGTTRASPPRPCRSSRTASSSATCRSRETAPRIGRQSGGAMRADGWNRIPLIRMTNINLLPKPGMSLDEIVADTDDGLYLASNRTLVDRRSTAELPVRDRGRLRDQGRQEGPAVQEPDLHRHHLRVLALLRCGRRRARAT